MYKLREDCSGKGITIASSDVTLDLARHTMTGTGASGNFGIYAVDVGNVRIVGPGVIKKYYEGMLLAEVSGISVGNVTIRKSTALGVDIELAEAVTLEGTTVESNGAHGIYESSTAGNLF